MLGAQGAITRGMHPAICAGAGVTICFGGILRDLLCQRPVAIGGQSYALATAAGATVYVGMRQLVVAGYPIPLVARIAMAMGTAVAQRALSFWDGRGVHDSSFLAPMANYQIRGAAAARSACLRCSSSRAGRRWTARCSTRLSRSRSAQSLSWARSTAL